MATKEAKMNVEFYHYNPHRDRRGVEAVQMKILEKGKLVELLWMSKSDIIKNIKEFGSCAAFERGLACYEKGEEV